MRTFVRKLLLMTVVVALASAKALAVTPVMLIGPDLKPRRVMLQSFGGGKITFFDSERTLQIESTGKLLQIRVLQDEERTAEGIDSIPAPSAGALSGAGAASNPNADPAAAERPRPHARIDLIDGQRLVADWLGASEDGQKLNFEHPTIGKVSVSLEVVSRLMFDGSTVGGATPASDRVLLSNGDAMEGFVTAISSTAIGVQIGSAKPIQLPIERVRGVVLANPLRQSDKPRDLVMLRDGSRFVSDSVSIEADQIKLSTALGGAQSIRLDMKEVARVELASPKGRLVDLSEMPMKVIEGGEVFGLAMPPRVEGDVIRLHAPVTVEFQLPDNARRFAAVAELDASGPNARWADFVVSLRSGGKQIARQAISDIERAATINTDLSGTMLTIVLDPSTNGPVMDRLRLREAVVYVENK